MLDRASTTPPQNQPPLSHRPTLALNATGGALTYDPHSSMQHWPTPMLRFGVNPYGDPLYRIVLSSSRMNLAIDDDGVAVWIPTYTFMDKQGRPIAMWVMERWLSAWDFCQMTPRKWNETMLILGPYPERGEYQHCHSFETCTPTDANLEKLISWIEEGKTRPFAEHLKANKGQYENEEKAKRAKMNDIILDKWSSYGCAPFVGGAGVKRGTKTRPILKTANELGLPIGNNKFSTIPSKKVKNHVASNR